MNLVLLSILVLAAGPALFRLTRWSQASMAGLDGFIRVAVGGMLLVHVLPSAWSVGGWIAAIAFLLGMLAPLGVHRLLESSSGLALVTELAIGLSGLALHAFLDGAALISHEVDPHYPSQMLAIAVVMHRLPVGMGVWWLVRPRFGKRAAWIALASMAAATVAGGFLSEGVLSAASSSWIAAFHAFMVGALLHVVLGHTFQLPGGLRRQVDRLASGLGGLAGIALLLGFAVVHVMGEGELPASESLSAFLHLAAQSAPALLAASITITLTKALLPGSMVGFFRGRTRFSQAMRGTVAGLPVPICSCGVIPMYRGLIQAGTPASAALAFLVAAPEVGWAAILLSIGLLGTEMTLLRLGGAALLALAVGMVVGGLAQRELRVAEVSAPSTRMSLVERLRAGFSYGFGRVVDDTAPWILVGLTVAAILEPTMGSEWLAGLPVGVDVLIATLIGLPLYVCASGSTPLVAVLLFKGLSPGAAIAFLLTGPATNLTTAGVLSQMHSRKVAAAFGVTMVVMAVAVGFLTNALFAGAVVTTEVAPAHEHMSTGDWVALVALAVVYAASLLRVGVPGFIGTVVSPHDADEAPHDQDSSGHETAQSASPGDSCCHEETVLSEAR